MPSQTGTDAADRDGHPPIRPAGAFDPLITAEEVFPALERAAWSARRSIWMAYRIFEPTTRIRSPDIPCETWRGLLRAKLEQGVSIRIALADFDPIVAVGLHETTWRSFLGFAELLDHGDIEILPIRHEARVGRGLQYGLWAPAMMQLDGQRRALNGMDPDERRARFYKRPGIWRYLRLGRTGRVRWRAYRLPRLYPVTHHQKIAVFDGERAIIGGLDINERRWDDKTHDRRAEETWHDVSVLVDGPVARDIARHVADGWNRARHRMARLRRQQQRNAPPGVGKLPLPAGELPDPGPSDETAEQGLALVRTVSDNKRDWLRLSPVTHCAEIEAAHVRLIGAARRLIYIESQVLRSRPVADALARAARAVPGLGLIMLLPAAPEQIAFQDKSGLPERFGEHLHSECIDTVTEAFGDRCAIVSPARPVARPSDGRDSTHGAGIIYVHAKVIVVDDREAIVSSANLNGRSLCWDTEAGVLCNVPAMAAHLRRRLFEHWLPAGAGDEFHGLDTATAAWRRCAHENAARPPAERTGFILPHEAHEAERLGMAVPGLPEEAV